MIDFGQITFRDKRGEDEAFCFRLYSLVQAERLGWANNPQTETLLKLTYAGFRRTYESVIPPSEDQIILAHGALIGRLIVLHAPGEIRLADISLLPEWRNQGIGTHCVRTVVELARKNDLPLRLQTDKTNRAYQLYRRLRFNTIKVGDLDFEMELNDYENTTAR